MDALWPVKVGGCGSRGSNRERGLKFLTAAMWASCSATALLRPVLAFAIIGLRRERGWGGTIASGSIPPTVSLPRYAPSLPNCALPCPILPISTPPYLPWQASACPETHAGQPRPSHQHPGSTLLSMLLEGTLQPFSGSMSHQGMFHQWTQPIGLHFYWFLQYAVSCFGHPITGQKVE